MSKTVGSGDKDCALEGRSANDGVIIDGQQGRSDYTHVAVSTRREDGEFDVGAAEESEGEREEVF